MMVARPRFRRVRTGVAPVLAFLQQLSNERGDRVPASNEIRHAAEHGEIHAQAIAGLMSSVVDGTA